VTILVTLLAAVAAAGCASLPGTSAEDAAAAKETLERANAAMETIESLRFSMVATGEANGQQFSIRMQGGGYLKGKRSGDMALEGTIEAPGIPAMKLELISRNGTMYVNMGGGWQSMPGQAAGLDGGNDEGADIESALAGFDLTRYVRDVRVERHTTFLGEPVTKIVGTIDTQALIGGMLDQLGTNLSALGPAAATEALEGLGDVHAELYVSEATDYLRAAHIALTLEQDGQTASVDLTFTLLDGNEKILLPRPPASALAATA
jgi:hypothetical protein